MINLFLTDRSFFPKKSALDSSAIKMIFLSRTASLIFLNVSFLINSNCVVCIFLESYAHNFPTFNKILSQ